MNAINVIKNVRSKLPQPNQNGAFELNQLSNMPHMSSEELFEWAAAEELLSKYKTQ